MANRRPLTLNPGGYQEYFQSSDTLQVDGSISINGASFTSVVPLSITGPGESNLGAAAIVGSFKASEITVDANTGDTVVITLGSDGNISASGRVEATSININSSTVVDGVLDEDTLVSDSETKLATQQSIKAYVDAITKTVRFAADTGNGTIEAGDNITDTVTIAGTVNEIETSVSGDTITLTLASTVVLDVVLVNSLQINGSTTVDGILDEDDFASDSSTKLATQQSIKAFSENYTDTQIAAIPNATQSVRGFQSPADKTKLDNIEAGATEDQTGAEIKALYEAEPNAYTDTKNTKLAGIEEGATADQTAAEIRVLVDSASDSNVFTDADHAKLDGIEDSATADQTGAEIKALYEAEPSAFTDAQFTKLAGIETAATADQTGAEIKALYETEPNAFTDAQFTKLSGIEAGATADQTDAEIRAAVEAATDSNVFTDADHTKLDAIEAGAEVNVPHDLSYTASTRALDITNGTGTTLPEATTTEAGLQSAADKTKIDGIEVGATADQTAAEIRSLVDSANDSNVFTNSDHTKLDGIEDGAQVNLAHDLSYTPSTREIAITNGTNITLPLAISGGDAGLLAGSDQTQLDSLTTNLAGKADLVGGKLSVSQVPDIAITEFLGNVISQADLTTLSGQKGDWATVQSQGVVYIITENDGSTLSDWTALEYPASMANLSYDSATRTVISDGGTDAVLPEVVSGGISGLMTGAQASKLDGIETAATADQTAAEIRTLVESATDSNVFTDADHTKLNAIEAGAEVNVPTDLTYDAVTRTVESSTGDNTVIPHVVSSGNSGLISGADKAKLDGIEAGATADQTKADIDALNIDADTLDGVQGSSYLRSDAADTMTQATANTPTLTVQNTGGHANDAKIARFYGDSDGIEIVHIGGGDYSIRNSQQNNGINIFDGTGGIQINYSDTPKLTFSGTHPSGQFAGTPNVNGSTMWHAGNDGAGSGLDADTVDGLEAASFLRSDANDTYTSGVLTFGSGTLLNCASNDVYVSARRVSNRDGGSDGLYLGTGNTNGMPTYVGYGAGSEMLKIDGSLTFDSNTVWHAGNDGSGSGLDADKLDGLEGSYYLDYNNLNNTPGAATKGDIDALNVDADTVDGLEAANFLRSDENDVYTGELTGAGNIRFSGGVIEVGKGSGSVAMTINDGHGNANLSFNHAYGIPDVNGNALRIETNVDSTSNAQFIFEGKSNVTANAGTSLTQLFTMTETGATCLGNTVWHAGNDGAASGLDADLLDGQHGSYYAPANTPTFDGIVSVGDGTGQDVLELKKADNNSSDHLRFFNGTTRMGEIGCEDTTWLRINQETNKNIYTPRYIRADGGFFVRGTAKGINGSGNLIGANITKSDALSVGSTNGDINFNAPNGSLMLVANAYGFDQGGGLGTAYLDFADLTADRFYYFPDAEGSLYVQGEDLDCNNLTVAGSLTIPNKLIHAGDTDTYFQFEAANKARIVVAGGEVMEWGNNYALMNDSDTLRMGTGSDFRMFFNGADMYFRNYAHANGDIIFQGENSAGTNQNIQIMKTDGTRTYNILYENNAERFRTTSAGVTITGALTATGDVTAFSDITLKKDIEVIPNALDKVSQIRGVTYKRTDTEEPLRQAGVIAQEVEEVLPEVVHTNEDGIKSVAYGNLVSLLIESVKELKARVEELENN